MVSAVEGNRAGTKTMLPVIETFMAAHQLPDVTVVADAGMISEGNQKAIEAKSDLLARPTAPSRSRPASTSSPPPTPFPTTSARPWTPSTAPAEVRTNLS
jgi:transposase